MTESNYQSKITKWIDSIDGQWVNGKYTKAGEADLQCCVPLPGYDLQVALKIEVKTPANYIRVMRAIDENYNVIDAKKLKPHETLQMTKIRRARDLGILALVASSIEHIQDYIYEVTNENI